MVFKGFVFINIIISIRYLRADLMANNWHFIFYQILNQIIMKNFIWVLFVVFSLFACEKEIDDNNPTNVTEMKNLVVSSSFNWKSYTETSLNVQVTGVTKSNDVVYLFDDNSRRIGVTTLEGGVAKFNVGIPGDVEFVTVFIPSTRSSIKIDDYKTTSNHTMSYQPSAKGNKFVDFFQSPDCSDGCTVTNANSNNNLNVNDGDVMCLTGSVSGTVTLNGNSTLRICGTANISNLNLNGSGTKTIVVTNYGSLNISNFSPNSSFVLQNYSNNCVISGNFNNGGDMQNYGVITTGAMNVTNGGSVYNMGTINVSGDFTAGDYLENGGTIAVSGTITLNSAEVYNYCKMTAGANFYINNTLENSGYLKSANDMVINGTSTIYNYYEGMLSTKNLTLNGIIYGGTSFGEVKVTNNTLINGTGRINGQIDFCDENGVETNNGIIAATVTTCQGYIEINSCNPEGFGVSASIDSDNDGIADDLDDYPTNINLAFKNLSPYSGYKTIAFEDLWPAIGDFDFNDLMIKTKVEYKSDENNKLVSADYTIVLSAVGAGLQNGIGLQLLNASNIKIYQPFSSVSGASLDPADNSCVKITNDVFQSQSTYYNNTGNQYFKTPDTLHFTVVFNQSLGLEFDDITEDFYIFRTNDRGLEIHVANRPPTSAMNTSYFGQSQDASKPSQKIYYKTANNLPWAFEIIDGNGSFKNPLEKIQIIDAYGQFQNWVRSNGTTNATWYNFPNSSKIFNKSF